MRFEEDLFSKAFYCFILKTKTLHQKWVLTGSYRLFLDGAIIYPKDIDILTTIKGVNQIAEIFKESVIRPPSSSIKNDIKSYFCQLKIDGVSFDIIGNMNSLIDGQWKRIPNIRQKPIVLKNSKMNIPVFHLDYEYKVNDSINRSNIKDIIKKLKKKK